MCNSNTNLWTAIQEGKFTRMPFLAYILNLMVHHYLVKYHGLQDLLRQEDPNKMCLISSSNIAQSSNTFTICNSFPKESKFSQILHPNV